MNKAFVNILQCSPRKIKRSPSEQGEGSVSNADASCHSLCSNAALFILFFLLKIKKKIAVKSYFQGITLEIGFILWESKPRCCLSRGNFLEYKQETKVIVSYLVWLYVKKKTPFVDVN